MPSPHNSSIKHKSSRLRLVHRRRITVCGMIVVFGFTLVSLGSELPVADLPCKDLIVQPQAFLLNGVHISILNRKN